MRLLLPFALLVAACTTQNTASGPVDASTAREGGASSPDASAAGDTGAPSPDANSFFGGVAYDGGLTCQEAGGTCLIGDNICATPGDQYCPGELSPAGIFCCLSQVEDCGQPAALTFSACDAGASSITGCPSPPPLPAPFEQADAGPSPPGPFPSGCTVTFPYCNQGVVTNCVCQGTNWTCYL